MITKHKHYNKVDQNNKIIEVIEKSLLSIDIDELKLKNNNEC